MKILFVCEGNINRSQIAGTIFKFLIPDDEVITAGVYADHSGELLAEVPDGPVTFMKNAGYDMSLNRVSQLTQDMVSKADQIVLVGPVPRGPIPRFLSESPKLEVWDVPDPGYAQISLKCAYDMIEKYVHELAKKS